MHNFKNIPKTLAMCHQHYMCLQLVDKEGYLRPQAEFSSGMSHVCSVKCVSHTVSLLSFIFLASETAMMVGSLEHPEDGIGAAPELSQDTVVHKYVQTVVKVHNIEVVVGFN